MILLEKTYYYGLSFEGGICSCIGSTPPVEDVAPSDEDVLAEETIVKHQAASDEIDPSTAVQVRGLMKTYPGTTNVGCCKCKRTPPYHAVKVPCSSFLVHIIHTYNE